LILFLLGHQELTPEEAAAFWQLGLLDAEGVKQIAMTWLENGAASYQVAALAAEPDPNYFPCSKLFIQSLSDMGVAELPSEACAVKIAMIYFLQKIVDRSVDPFEGMNEIIRHLYYDGYKLFDKRDPRIEKPPKSDNSEYAGQGLGIELLYGLYCSTDDYDNITALQEKVIAEEIIENAEYALNRYYQLNV
jgi:hypothetical protein